MSTQVLGHISFLCFLLKELGKGMPHSPLQLLVLSPCQTLAFYEDVQCPEEKVIRPWGEGINITWNKGGIPFPNTFIIIHVSWLKLVYVLLYLGSSSLSISIYFLFWAFPGAASSSFLIWARRIFWKSSWVKTRLVLTAAALAFRSSMGMLFSLLDLRAHNKGLHGYRLKGELNPHEGPA